MIYGKVSCVKVYSFDDINALHAYLTLVKYMTKCYSTCYNINLKRTFYVMDMFEVDVVFVSYRFRLLQIFCGFQPSYLFGPF